MKSRIPNAKLDLVGTSDMQDPIEGIARTLHLEDRVRLHFEWILEQVRMTNYSEADPCAFPRLCYPFCSPDLEAKSVGKPFGGRGITRIKQFATPYGSHNQSCHVNSYEPNNTACGITSALEKIGTAKNIVRNCGTMVLDHYRWDVGCFNECWIVSGFPSENVR